MFFSEALTQGKARRGGKPKFYIEGESLEEILGVKFAG